MLCVSFGKSLSLSSGVAKRNQTALEKVERLENLMDPEANYKVSKM